jgi:hypothetical protein
MVAPRAAAQEAVPDLGGLRPGGPDLPRSRECEQIRLLRSENCKLRRANELLTSVSRFSARELDPHRPK